MNLEQQDNFWEHLKLRRIAQAGIVLMGAGVTAEVVSLAIDSNPVKFVSLGLFVSGALLTGIEASHKQ